MDEEVSCFIERINIRTRQLSTACSSTPASEKNAKHFGINPELKIVDCCNDNASSQSEDYNTTFAVRSKREDAKLSVKLEDVHHHGRSVILTGRAGSGKTTLLSRYCLYAQSDFKLSDIKLVHYLSFKNIPNINQSPQEFLFSCIDRVRDDDESSCLDKGYEWLQDESNQRGVLFVFDDLDAALCNLTNEYMGYVDKKSPATIIYNILRGNIFPGCKILAASRQGVVAHFLSSVQPDAVVLLAGFSLTSIKSLVMACCGGDGPKLWKKLNQNAGLLEICSIPVFLHLFITLYRTQGTLETTTGTICYLIQNYLRPHPHIGSEEFKEILKMLQQLSYCYVMEDRISFTEADFEKFRLRSEDVEKLVFSVPTSTTVDCSIPLLVKDWSHCICHRCFQEALAALHILQLDWAGFEETALCLMELEKFVVIGQFICGMLFNSGVPANDWGASVPELEKKRSLVLEILRRKIVDSLDQPAKMLNLILTLNECRENPDVIDVVQRSLTKVVLSGISLKPSDMHALGNVVSICRAISIMQLDNCNLDKYSVKSLVDGISNSSVEILVFDVSFNNNLRKDSLPYIREICLHGQGLNYWQCGFKQRDILSFVEEKIKLEPQDDDFESDEEIIQNQFYEDHLLNLSPYDVENNYELLDKLVSQCMSEIHVHISEFSRDSDVSKLCQLLAGCERIEELAIARSDLSKEQMSSIYVSVSGKKIETLNVYLSPKIDVAAWVSLGLIMLNCSPTNLYLTACCLTEFKLDNLILNIAEIKIKKLDISRHNGLSQNCISQLACVIKNCGIMELVMGYCDLTGSLVQCLNQNLNDCLISRIDVSGNECMGLEGFTALGEIVQTCHVKLLDISECDPSSVEMTHFQKAVKNAHISKLNVSRNRNLKENGLNIIGQLVEQCNLQELFVRQCELEENTLRAFKRGLGNGQIPYLDFGLYFMKKRQTTKAELSILLSILPQVGKQMTLNSWEFDAQAKETFQEALDNIPYRGLKIVFNRGKDEFIQQRS